GSSPSGPLDETALRRGVRLLEQRLPPVEQRLELVAGRTVGRKQLDVTPVLCQTALQGGHRLLLLGDSRLDLLELARPLRRWLCRTSPVWVFHTPCTPGGFRSQTPDGTVTNHARFSRSHVVGPAAVVAADSAVLD